ncbi:hypothetical protein LCGC14_1258860 [marine sediment metagenome]|uniref:Uncharacterized protein n=1 Tax=marine sediment metagenome TaxID=412755 RepID=A0A0F9NI03_9ZZZZ
MTHCPCELPDGVENAYHCALITEISGVVTRMTPDWCRLYLMRDNYHKAWDEGRGPGHPTKPSEKPGNPAKQIPQTGPGTELLKMLKKPVGVLRFLGEVREFLLRRQKKKKGCADSCKGYARKMNAWGVAGCRDRLEKIVDHLEAQASREGIRFSRRAAGLMVRWAIRRAERTSLLA